MLSLLLVVPQPQRQCHTSSSGLGVMLLEQLSFTLPMKKKHLHHLWCLNNPTGGYLSHQGIQDIQPNPPSPYAESHNMEMQQTQPKKCQQLTLCGSEGKCAGLFLITTNSEVFFQHDLQSRNNLIWRFLFFNKIKETQLCLRARYKLLLKKRNPKLYWSSTISCEFSNCHLFLSSEVTW